MSRLTLIQTFTKERERLLTLARRWLGNDTDAEDAVQDAFLRLWPRAEQIDSKGYSQALVTTTLKNLTIDLQRKRRIATTQLNEQISVAEPPPNDTRSEMLATVNRIIEHELSETQRRIIHMREYHSMEYDDIASELGMTPTAVRMQLSRARKKIQTIAHNKQTHHQAKPETQ